MPGPGLSGMFFSRYGSGVVVGANDSDQPARLRDHAVAYVYYFNAKGDPIEQRVDTTAIVQAKPTPPIDFAAPIRLEGFELANPQVKKGQPIILVLYWRALKRIDKDYSVFVRLVDKSGNEIAGYEKYPRDGKSPTSRWVPGQRIVDAIVMSVPDRVPIGNYRLEVGLSDPSTMLPVLILNAASHASRDRVSIEPLWSSE